MKTGSKVTLKFQNDRIQKENCEERCDPEGRRGI